MTDATTTDATTTGDGPLVLRSPRSTSARILAAGVLLAGLGIAGALTHTDVAAAWVTVALGVWACGVGICDSLWPPTLEVSDRGLRTSGRGRRPAFVAWSECRDFRAFTLGRATKVMFDYDGSDPRWSRRRATANLAIAQANGCLPATYGMAADDLAELLEERRQAAAAPRRPDDAGAARA